MSTARLVAMVSLSLGLTGCGTGMGGGFGGGSPAPLPASPVAPVTSGALQPLVVTPMQTQPNQAGQIVGGQPAAPAAAVPPVPATPGAPLVAGQPIPPGAPGVAGAPPVPGQPGVPGQVAMATPEAPAKAPSADSSVAVSRSELSGGWTLRSGGESCQLTLSLSQWTGGYRASQRGCSSPDIARISAWSIEGKQVTLRGSDGSTVATLYASTKEQFNGVTSTRKPISFSR